MSKSYFLFQLFLVNIFIIIPKLLSFTGKKIPIVFVYTLNKNACHMGLPNYVKYILKQVVNNQNLVQTNIYLLSNYKQCPSDMFNRTRAAFPHISFIDTEEIKSNRTSDFILLSDNLFSKHPDPRFKPGLWATSVQRFFHLEDFMKAFQVDEFLQAEMDILLYGDLLIEAIPALRKFYDDRIGITPATTVFSLASILWVPSLVVMEKLNNYFLTLAKGYRKDFPAQNETANIGEATYLWLNYTDWIRSVSGWSRKKTNLMVDRNGLGIKVADVNEMSMLAYYIKITTTTSHLPILPATNYGTDFRPKNSQLAYIPGGSKAGPATGSGIWDPSSWGQFLGGEYFQKKYGFVSPDHIIGKAFGVHNCTVAMLCERSIPLTAYQHEPHYSNTTLCERRYKERVYVTAPYVKCGNTSYNSPENWSKVYNLHIHSKVPEKLISEPCNCITGSNPKLVVNYPPCLTDK